MFYSYELLSLRRRGKFARCWLAATISEKLFKKTVRQTALEKIKVTYLCQEILSAIEIRNDRVYNRMSLYLVAQLMYGAAKILLYQTQLLQDIIFETTSSLSSKRRLKDEFTLEMALNVPNDPPISQMFNAQAVSRKMHLITERPYSSVMNHLIQDETNFGVLTDFELENFMLPEEEEQFLNEIRKFNQSELQQIIDTTFNIRDIEFNESGKELRESFSKKDQREFLVDDGQFKKPATGTPKKRTTKSLPETPTKKRKMSSEVLTPPYTSVEVPLVDVHELQPAEVIAPAHRSLEVPLPHELQPAEVIAQRLEPIQVPDLELQPLIHEHVESTGDTKKRRIGKKLYDKETMLSNNVLRNAIENVAIHTVEHFSHIPKDALSAKKYLTQPALKIFNRPWAETLIKLFERHLVKPSVTQNEFSSLQIDEPAGNETLRPDPSSKVNIQDNDESSKLQIIEPNDHSKTINKTQPIELPYSEYVPGEQQKQEITGPHPEEVPLPEITVLEEKVSETTKELEIQLNGRKPNSTSGSTSSCRVSITKAEFQALLEVHWHQGDIAKFHDIISPNNYNRLDASRAFIYCLELHAEKIVLLKQTEPYDTIYIQKYPYNTSGTSDENGENLL